MRLEWLRRWLAEILWPRLHELDVICEMNRVEADVVNGEWRKDRERVGILERKVKRLENENANLKMWISDAKIALIAVRGCSDGRGSSPRTSPTVGGIACIAT